MANKRYDQFSSATPTGSRITLHADAATGALAKCTLTELIALAYPPDLTIKTVQGLGSSIINFNAATNLGLSNAGQAMGSQQAFFVAIYLPACTINNFVYCMATAGVFTASNFNGIALFSLSGTTLSQVGTTANDANIWKGTALAWRSAALTAPLTVTAGVYFIGLVAAWSAQTTIPQFLGQSLTNQSYNCQYAFGTSIQLVWYQSSVTTLATTFNATTRSGIPTTLPAFGVTT